MSSRAASRATRARRDVRRGHGNEVTGAVGARQRSGGDSVGAGDRAVEADESGYRRAVCGLVVGHRAHAREVFAMLV
jgi:hypothetical protein